MKNCLIISTGSNVGDLKDNLLLAKDLLIENLGDLLKESALYQSDSWGFDGATFLNQILILDTEKTAQESIDLIMDIETEMGRSRNNTNQYFDRLIDIDIIFYNSEIIDEVGLKVPHPKMHLRNFVLEPLNELIPEFIHPELQKSIDTLSQESMDKVKAILIK